MARAVSLGEVSGALRGAIPDGERQSGGGDPRGHGAADGAEAEEGGVHAARTYHRHYLSRMITPCPRRGNDLPALRAGGVHGARRRGGHRAGRRGDRRGRGRARRPGDGRAAREAIAVAGYTVRDGGDESAGVAA